jgi:adenylosuccinate synthase
VGDLLSPSSLETKLSKTLEEKNVLFERLYQAAPVRVEEVYAACLEMGEKLRPFVEDVGQRLIEARKQKRSILFEGAQGTLLDIDHGTYPFVTSSNTTAGNALTGTGVGIGGQVEVLGILKAYTTRVGTGPSPTEIEKTEPEIAEKIRSRGAEFGATTGRARRIGWLDLVALKYAVEVNGLTGLALMKSDVLAGLAQVKLGVGYEIRGKRVQAFPSSIEDLEIAMPLYESMPGWGELTLPQDGKVDSLDPAFRAYVARIEKELGVPVVLLSLGPEREKTLIRRPFFGLPSGPVSDRH